MKKADQLGLPRRTKASKRMPYTTPFMHPAPMPGKGRSRKELLRVLFNGGASSAIAHAFDLMSVCEVELAKAGLEALSRTTNLFNLLCPPSAMCEPTVSDEVYRAHCAELLGRVKTARGQSKPGHFIGPVCQLHLPTKAELLMALHHASLKHPLDRDLSLIMEQCFEHVFPGKVEASPDAYFNAKQGLLLQKSEQEVLDGLMVRLRVKDRKLESHGPLQR